MHQGPSAPSSCMSERTFREEGDVDARAACSAALRTCAPPSAFSTAPCPTRKSPRTRWRGRRPRPTSGAPERGAVLIRRQVVAGRAIQRAVPIQKQHSPVFRRVPPALSVLTRASISLSPPVDSSADSASSSRSDTMWHPYCVRHADSDGRRGVSSGEGVDSGRGRHDASPRSSGTLGRFYRGVMGLSWVIETPSGQHEAL